MSIFSSKNNLKYQKRILKKAKQSTCKMRVAALGFNKDHVCVMARTNKPRFHRKGGGDHAEALIMKEAKKKGIVYILICRIGKGGEFRPIDPCSKCQTIADKLEIKIETLKLDSEKECELEKIGIK